MTPRVFISSTYYDLKHVRERLEQFIEGYGFEPVLFESDKVTYELDKPIDKSAYYEVTLCHIMVLIIGGRYGTPASQQDDEGERQKIYEDEFVSITRRELETAIQNNIPVFVFIDKNVYSEYHTYRENIEFFSEQKKGEKKGFKFAHVDSINIFRFIELVNNRPIKTFEKIEEIEKYLTNQFAGLFYFYLESLKKRSNDDKILDTVKELNNVSLRMNEMLKSVGEKILKDDEVEYQRVIENQFDILLSFFMEKVSENLSGVDGYIEESNTRKEITDKFLSLLEEKFSHKKPIRVETFQIEEEEYNSLKREEFIKFIRKFNPIAEIYTFNIITLQTTFHNKIKPLLINAHTQLKFEDWLQKTIFDEIDLPF